MNGPSNDWFWDRIAEGVKAFLVGAYVVGAGIVYRIYQRGVQRDIRIANLEGRTSALERYCREQREIAHEVNKHMREIKVDVRELRAALLRPPGH